MRVTRLFTVLTTITLVGLACSEEDVAGIPSDVEIFRATLNGANEVPALPTPTTATGEATITVMGNLVSWRVDVTNINNVSAGHIHTGDAQTPGPVTQNVSPTLGSVTATTTIAQGSAVVTDQLLADMRAGNTYVNIHTSDPANSANNTPGDYPGGEIRGQLRKL